ncbi:hypothetical protein HMPREF3192_00809 [Atopobium deltae]|uniref:Uncharacterized protein n=1 Tax=Atopobium deltae TaxID=1393034 RepID=A0A133XUT9_9ACTN|nr:hypothetical protein HMPREF3192_00809 [Atopobium deltae]
MEYCLLETKHCLLVSNLKREGQFYLLRRVENHQYGDGAGLQQQIC